MKYIIYTEEEGGDYKVLQKFATQDTFDEIVRERKIRITSGNMSSVFKPRFVALVNTEDDYDFVLNKSRELKTEKTKKASIKLGEVVEVKEE